MALFDVYHSQTRVLTYGSHNTLLSTIRIIDAEKTTLDALLIVHSLSQFGCLLVGKLTEANARAQSGGRVPFQTMHKKPAKEEYSKFTMVPTDCKIGLTSSSEAL